MHTSLSERRLKLMASLAASLLCVGPPPAGTPPHRQTQQTQTVSHDVCSGFVHVMKAEKTGKVLWFPCRPNRLMQIQDSKELYYHVSMYNINKDQ